MNSGYVLWFGALVIVAGAALLWLAVGRVPEIPAEPATDADPGQAGESEADGEPRRQAPEFRASLAPGPASDPDWTNTWEPLSGPGPPSERGTVPERAAAPEPGAASAPDPRSERSGEDRVARPG